MKVSLVCDWEGCLVLVHCLEGLLNRFVIAVQDGIERLVAKDVAGNQGLQVGHNQVL